MDALTQLVHRTQLNTLNVASERIISATCHDPRMAFQCCETVTRARAQSRSSLIRSKIICIHTDPLSCNGKSQQCWKSRADVRERRVGPTEKRNNGSRGPKRQNWRGPSIRVGCEAKIQELAIVRAAFIAACERKTNTFVVNKSSVFQLSATFAGRQQRPSPMRAMHL